MTRITAIELENFQSIEQRTRIELKPITLLFGPNSAGKSTVFDALELIRVLLDPTIFNEKIAADMVNRWARHKSDEAFRETFLAIEFPYEYRDPMDFWNDDSNWQGVLRRSDHVGFYLDNEPRESGLLGSIIRIELLAKVGNKDQKIKHYLSEFSYSINGRPLIELKKMRRNKPHLENLPYIDTAWEVYSNRWLSLFNTYDDVNYSLFENLKQQISVGKVPDSFFDRDNNVEWTQMRVISDSLSPANFTLLESHYGLNSAGGEGDPTSQIGLRVSELIFYFGTLLWGSMRADPGIVLADRRTPKPTEALCLVDIGLMGRSSSPSFSPSSPAALLISASKNEDEHFRGLAEVAYADLLLRAADAYSWLIRRAPQIAKNIEDVRNGAVIFEKINHHLSKNLFTEKLYKLSCAATLLVPIDLEEDDLLGDYALAQPAAVRLFLQDGDGRKVELQDVGSGIPFVLPVLYAVACQGIVKVQQPELHLHPALQSSMADIFVEELNCTGSGQFIIETHSEHVLLRLLRRIRDVEKDKCLSEDMKLTNKDISVYYFDPQVSGGTVVTQLLVTPLGDFYTDWPQGFFQERNGDLFDE